MFSTALMLMKASLPSLLSHFLPNLLTCADEKAIAAYCIVFPPWFHRFWATETSWVSRLAHKTGKATGQSGTLAKTKVTAEQKKKTIYARARAKRTNFVRNLKDDPACGLAVYSPLPLFFWTCTLRKRSRRVECFGVHSNDWCCAVHTQTARQILWSW